MAVPPELADLLTPGRRPAELLAAPEQRGRLYVRGTAEDPASGAHEDFREQLTDVAQDIAYFDRKTSDADLLAWYHEGRLSTCW